MPLISTGVAGHRMKHGCLRRSLSLILVVSLLAPGLGSAQPPAGAQLSQPPGDATRAPQPPGSSPARGTMPGPDYRLGPGDVLDVQIAGRLEVIRQQAVVDLEGAINVPPLGAVPLAGLTLLEAHRRVAQRAREMFRFAEATVTVMTPRTFEIVVSGEVERPGTLPATALRRLHDVILDAGGITARGSTRHVLVTRRGVESEIDLLAFQLRGDLTQNPLMEEGLKIHVPARTGSVTLMGAVRRPGEYELGATPSLRALLELVGGVSQAAADGDARLTRVGADGRKETFPLEMRAARKAPAAVSLQPGDEILVPPNSVVQDLVAV